LKKSFRDRVFQKLAHKFPLRLIWFCMFEALSMHQRLTKNAKLPSQVGMIEAIHRLDEKRFDEWE